MDEQQARQLLGIADGPVSLPELLAARSDAMEAHHGDGPGTDPGAIRRSTYWTAQVSAAYDVLELGIRDRTPPDRFSAKPDDRQRQTSNLNEQKRAVAQPMSGQAALADAIDQEVKATTKEEVLAAQAAQEAIKSQWTAKANPMEHVAGRGARPADTSAEDRAAAEAYLVAAQNGRADGRFGSDNILAELAPPYQLHGGPDILVATQTLDGRPGATVLIQNPYDAPIQVDVWVGTNRLDMRDQISGELAPLEVGRLSLPLRHDPPGHLRMTIAGHVAPGTARVREFLPKKYDTSRSAAGIASGLAGLLVMGVGRFSTTSSGGIVDQPLVVNWEVAAGARAHVSGTGVAYDRIWAPASARPAQLILERSRRSEELTTLGFLSLLGAAIVPVLVTVQFADAYKSNLGGSLLSEFVALLVLLGAMVVAVVATNRVMGRLGLMNRQVAPGSLSLLAAADHGVRDRSAPQDRTAR